MAEGVQGKKRLLRVLREHVMRIGIMAVLVLAMGCQAQDAVFLETAAAESSFYSAVLGAADSSNATIVVSRQTRNFVVGDTDAHRQAAFRSVPELWEDTVTSFERRNSAPVDLGNLVLARNVALMDEEELAAGFVENVRQGWKDFHERFPQYGQIVMLSRVGFSKDGRQALVYCHRSVGPTEGIGYLVLLQRTDDKWRVLREVPIEMS